MNKFKKISKIEIAYQLIAQIHSDLCNKKERNNTITEKALDLTLEILKFKSLIEKTIPDDTELQITNATAQKINTKIRDELFEAINKGKTKFTFDEIEHIVCKATNDIQEA